MVMCAAFSPILQPTVPTNSYLTPGHFQLYNVMHGRASGRARQSAVVSITSQYPPTHPGQVV